MKTNFSRNRSSRGLTLVECTSAMALFIPVTVLLTFVTIEATKAYEISRDLQLAAGLAARALAHSGSTTTAQQQDTILSNVRISNTVVDPSQFYKVQWNKSNDPPTVTVCVQSKSTGSRQPQTFPNPDPLNLGSQFNMTSSATYRLQS